MNHTYEYFLNKATAYCAKSEKCINDVREYLKKYNAGSEDTERIIEYLQEENYINEQRYATAYTRDKYRFEKWGRIKISYNLKTKRIPSSAIDIAFDEIDEEEYLQGLKQLILSKLQYNKEKLASMGYNDEAKIFRFCSSRGYETNLIKLAMDELKSEADN